jgi:hypothetical protein
MDFTPADAIANPRIKCSANGIDLIFSEENHILTGHIRFQKWWSIILPMSHLGCQWHLWLAFNPVFT